MSTTPPSTHTHPRQRSTSRTRLPSRPTTPLRASSRASLRNSTNIQDPTSQENPLDVLEPQFAELSDAMTDLEANFLHLQLLNESLSRFSENFASFLYGLNMNAFCVDFGEAPVAESFLRVKEGGLRSGEGGVGSGFARYHHAGGDEMVDATFLTTDTSFVEHPPTSSKAMSSVSRGSTPAGRGIARGGSVTRGGGVGRGGIPTASGRGRASGIARGSGIARARGGVRGRGS